MNTSTHLPHTEVDSINNDLRIRHRTSTHDLHTEVDTSERIACALSSPLQLTTSTRRSTIRENRCWGNHVTSTHDLHTEVDGGKNFLEWHSEETSTHDLHTEVDIYAYGGVIYGLHFNSRPPHGGRLNHWSLLCAVGNFNSRPPHGGRRK